MGKPYKDLPMVGVTGFVCILSRSGTKLRFASVKPSAATLIRVAFEIRIPQPFIIKRAAEAALLIMVGVTGFEPVASWSRTKRDTKLRHTPKAKPLYA